MNCVSCEEVKKVWYKKKKNEASQNWLAAFSCFSSYTHKISELIKFAHLVSIDGYRCTKGEMHMNSWTLVTIFNAI